MCFSADDIRSEMKFGWRPPDTMGCHTDLWDEGNPLAFSRLQNCLPPHTNGPAVYLIGDSKASVILEGLKKASKMPVYYASWQCNNDAKQRTDVFINYLRNVVKANDIIAFISSSASYKAHAAKLVALAYEKQMKLVLLGDYPMLKDEPGVCFQKSQPGAETICSVPKATWLNHVPKKDNDAFAKQEAAASPGMVFFHDMTDGICPTEKCDMWVPGTSHPAYMDKHHVNKLGSSYMAQSFCKFLSTNRIYRGGLLA